MLLSGIFARITNRTPRRRTTPRRTGAVAAVVGGCDAMHSLESRCLLSAALPTVSIADQSMPEGNSGSADMQFTVSLSDSSPTDVVVNYQTADGTATAAHHDYAPRTGSVTILAGQTSATLAVPVFGNQVVEADKAFTVTLTSADGADVADGIATGTIVNDDQPVVSISDTAANEGSAGSTTILNFTVTLSAPAAADISVHYKTFDGTATIADADYAAADSVLTIPHGQTSGTIAITLNGDSKMEPSETFTLGLSDLTGPATLPANLAATGTIRDDDTPTITVANATVTEGYSSQTNAVFSVTISPAATQTITLSYQTVNGTATTADHDYLSTTSTLTIYAGQTTAQITVPVYGDTKVELDETFQLNLTSASSGRLATTAAVATIVNDDLAKLTIADASATEGNSGTASLQFVVTLSDAMGKDVTVKYATSDLSATVADNDYQAATGTLTIPAGQKTGTITVLVNGDTKYEPDQTLKLTLSEPVNATLGTPTFVTGTIKNDEASAATIKLARKVGGKFVDLAENASPAVAFGTVVVNVPSAVQTFRVTNAGTTPLTLSQIKLPAGYSFARHSMSTLLPGASDLFQIRLLSAKAGTFNGTIQINSNDAAHAQFRINVAGTVTTKKAKMAAR